MCAQLRSVNGGNEGEVPPDALEFDSERAEWRVEQTGLEHDQLPAVTVAVRAGIASTQDYLTPDQADAMADALHAHAAWARAHAPLIAAGGAS